jgi:alpha-methylacyl-CoA racemase
MFLIAGILAALFEMSRSGKGQVVDAAMVDGASMLAAPFFAFMAAGFWTNRRGSNLLDSGAPFYDTYETADKKHVAVACLEPQFFAEFASLLPLEARFASSQYNRSAWDGMREAIAQRIGEKTRDEWAALFEGTDACVAPVLSFSEAPRHPHNRARRAHVKAGALERPAPAPRFSRTPSAAADPPREMGNIVEALARLGIPAEEVETLAKAGVVGR